MSKPIISILSLLMVHFLRDPTPQKFPKYVDMRRDLMVYMCGSNNHFVHAGQEMEAFPNVD